MTMTIPRNTRCCAFYGEISEREQRAFEKLKQEVGSDPYVYFLKGVEETAVVISNDPLSEEEIQATWDAWADS